MNIAEMTEKAVTGFVQDKLAGPAKSASSAPDVSDTPSLAKGLLAGAIAGAVATGAKTLVERVYPPRVHGEPEPTEVLADKVAGHALAPQPKSFASESIHWGFGIAVGAAYGALAEYYPAATSRDGASFGMSLMALTHEGALPAMGLSAQPASQSNREKTSEMVSHVVYGLATETVRRIVRKLLK